MCMLFLSHRLRLTQKKMLAVLTDKEQGKQLLGRWSPIKEETTASLWRCVLAMCLAGRVEVSNTGLREAVRLNEWEALGLYVYQNACLRCQPYLPLQCLFSASSLSRWKTGEWLHRLPTLLIWNCPILTLIPSTTTPTRELVAMQILGNWTSSDPVLRSTKYLGIANAFWPGLY